MSGRDALARVVALHRAGRLDEAIVAYRGLLSGAPDHVGLNRGLALALLQTGRRAEGLDIMRRAAAGAPADPGLQADLAAALRANGQHAEAVDIYDRLVDIADDPRIAMALGDALHAAGRPVEAASVLTGALDSGADPVPCRLLLARSLTEIGDAGGAVRVLDAADAGEDPRVRYALANALAADGQFERAAEDFRSLVEQDPRNADLHSQLGTALVGAGEEGEAEASFRRALAITPDEHRTVFRLGRLLARQGRIDGDHLRRWLRLERPISPLLRSSALDWVCSDPAFRRLARDRDEESSIGALGVLAGNTVLSSLLRRTIVDDPVAEAALTNARERLLAHLDDTGPGDGAGDKANLAIACDLAIQCHLNEHVWAVSPKERERIAGLENRLQESVREDQKPDPLRLAVLACYRPLSELEGSEALAAGMAGLPGRLQAVVRLQIADPAEEARIEPRVPQLNEHLSDTSSKVRQQYEEHPYPRWTERPELPGGSLESVLLGLFPHLADREIDWPESPQMLIAGCGTGLHSIITAQRFPAASILAMDLSRRSLAYAMRCTQEAGITNLTYGQGDLLRVGDLGRSFDVIESAGVLHHLLDPLEGWRSLVGVLRPGGVMKVGLYSETGRRAVVAGQRFVREQAFPGTTEGIREARRAIMALPEDHPAAGVLERPDFYSASACRDLLFHVQEHRYDLAQVSDMIHELGLEFVGFELAGRDHARAYRRRYPDDPDMLDLANWSELETSRPGMFSGMYLFWVRRPAAER